MKCLKKKKEKFLFDNNKKISKKIFLFIWLIIFVCTNLLRNNFYGNFIPNILGSPVRIWTVHTFKLGVRWVSRTPPPIVVLDTLDKILGASQALTMDIWVFIYMFNPCRLTRHSKMYPIFISISEGKTLVMHFSSENHGPRIDGKALNINMREN